MFHQQKLLAFSISVLFLNLTDPQFVSSQTTTLFDFPSFSPRNLTLLGDSYLRRGVLGLTRDSGVPSSSSGTVTFNKPINFSHPNTNNTASFSTRFTFSITDKNPTSSGDGLAFFISPENQTLGSSGGFLGLMTSTQLRDNRFIAVEFDTKLDSRFNDPNDNHVGIDVGTLVSIKTGDSIRYGIDLKSGKPITAWIDYDGFDRNLSVFLSYRSLKPETPILAAGCDLSGHLKGPMFVGFAGSTEGSTELHTILNWKFKFSGFGVHYHPKRPSIPKPHNVTENSVIPPPITAAKHRRRIGLGLGIACPAFFCAFLAIFGWVSVKRYKALRMEKSFKEGFTMTGPKQFNYRALREATRGFHHSRILGSGAFGIVYRANFQSSGLVSAVKRSRHSHEGKTEFLAELSIIACLRHKNLVQLQGWCVEKDELLLVYEFMPNGSLDKVLYQDTEQVKALNWSYRYNIAVGLASVLTYLHQECEQQVIHRDIKASNIMLDCNFNARLGDFGLARLMDHDDKSPVSTLTAGTMGYLAPEYLQYGKATEKTDVFSYGVVVLEVACGKRPIEKEEGGLKMVNLVDWVWGLHSEGRIIEAADGRLEGEFDEDGMKRLLLLGLSCANPDSEARPNMRRVMQILNGETDVPFVPREKPTLTFSSAFLPLNLEDIVSDDDDDSSLEDVIEIKIE